MSRASDENGQTVDLHALGELLDQADGLIVVFPHPLARHQAELMASLGVDVVIVAPKKSEP